MRCLLIKYGRYNDLCLHLFIPRSTPRIREKYKTCVRSRRQETASVGARIAILMALQNVCVALLLTFLSPRIQQKSTSDKSYTSTAACPKAWIFFSMYYLVKMTVVGLSISANNNRAHGGQRYIHPAMYERISCQQKHAMFKNPQPTFRTLILSSVNVQHIKSSKRMHIQKTYSMFLVSYFNKKILSKYTVEDFEEINSCIALKILFELELTMPTFKVKYRIYSDNTVVSRNVTVEGTIPLAPKSSTMPQVLFSV